MTKRSIAIALAALGISFAAAADDRLARFEGGIGVIPTGSTNTTVRTVPAAGQIWVIARLSADIRTDGSITRIWCRHENREAYHLSALVGHFVLYAEPPTPFLCLKSTPPSSRWPVYGGSTRIGADHSNDVLLDQDVFVSAEHACIERNGPQISIFDLDSRNGTFVNGRALRGMGYLLRTGDEIRIGHSTFELQAG